MAKAPAGIGHPLFLSLGEGGQSWAGGRYQRIAHAPSCLSSCVRGTIRWCASFPSPTQPPLIPRARLKSRVPTKLRLGLNSERSWVVIDEANDFIWPGPDLRPAVSGDPSSVAYGMLPPGFMAVLRQRLSARYKEKSWASTPRSE